MLATGVRPTLGAATHTVKSGLGFGPESFGSQGRESNVRFLMVTELAEPRVLSKHETAAHYGILYVQKIHPVTL